MYLVAQKSLKSYGNYPYIYYTQIPLIIQKYLKILKKIEGLAIRGK